MAYYEGALSLGVIMKKSVLKCLAGLLLICSLINSSENESVTDLQVSFEKILDQKKAKSAQEENKLQELQRLQHQKFSQEAEKSRVARKKNS